MSEPTRSAFRRLTGIGRPLDAAWPTNLAIAIATPIAGAIAVGVEMAREGVGADAVGFGVSAALGLFGGWALARELAPDAQATAFVAALFAWVAVLAVPGAGVLLIFVALIASRVLNRSVGVPPTPLDGVGASGLALFAVVSTGNAVVGFVVALAFAADAALSPRHPPSWGWAGLLFAGSVALGGGLIALPEAWTEGRPLAPLDPSAILGALDEARRATDGLLLPGLALLVAGWRLSRRSAVLTSVADETGEPLDPTRVRAGQLAALGLAVVPLLVSGGFPAVAPLWGAVMGSAILLSRAGGVRPVSSATDD